MVVRRRFFGVGVDWEGEIDCSVDILVAVEKIK